MAKYKSISLNIPWTLRVVFSDSTAYLSIFMSQLNTFYWLYCCFNAFYKISLVCPSSGHSVELHLSAPLLRLGGAMKWILSKNNMRYFIAGVMLWRALFSSKTATGNVQHHGYLPLRVLEWVLKSGRPLLILEDLVQAKTKHLF